MPVQLPTRTTAQIQQLQQDINRNSLYPYTFRINRTFTEGNFPSDDGIIGEFVQFTWTPAISLQILIFEANSVQPSGAIYTTAIQVSLSTTMTLGDAPSVTVPTDEGNILLQALFGINTNVQEQRFAPSGYYVRSGTPIYISFWIDAASMGQAGSVISTLLIHALPLGVGV